MSTITAEIMNSIDIAQLIGETVKLRPSSRGYAGLCPFHNEDTPSFHVYTDTQSYYCFGCQRGGNVFSYVMEKEHVSFREALQILADRAGITLNDTSMKRSRDIHDVLKQTEGYYSDYLSKSQIAQSYLQKRQLNNSDIKRFHLGYAPESWDALTLYLRKQGVTDKMMIDSGVSIQSRTGIYDRFRGRIIFPVHDITGRTIAFGGRIVSGDGAKYINSPESETYHKRRNLYMIDTARRSMLEHKRSILCEGYMDAIRLHKNGFTESVASLGTSLTPEQAEILSRYADRCYICYDSDTAGQNATIRGMYILQAHGLDVRVISLPDGKDPDEYLLTHEPKEFEGLIESAEPLVKAHLRALSPRLQDPLTKKTAIRELFSSLKSISASEVLEYKGSISEATGIIPSELERMIITKTETTEKTPAPKVQAKPKSYDDRLECAFCSMLMESERYRLSVKPEEVMSLIYSPEVREAAMSIMNEDVSTLMTLWLELNDRNKLGIMERGRIMRDQMNAFSDDEKFIRTYQGLKRASIDRRIEEIMNMDMKERDMNEVIKLYQERERYTK